MNNKKCTKFLNIIYWIVLCILCVMMLFGINQKEGFHEDEMFSYGSSNYSQDNVFQPYGTKDYITITIENEILNSKSPIKSFKHYIFHPNEFMNRLYEEEKSEQPIWKTSDEARKYLTIQKEDIFNFVRVYINQSRDAHPPLFYFFVHIISIFFYNKFSKYIIFIINILFFVGSCISLKKIMEKLEKSYLSIPILILYGCSIGAISTVIFQRMYMMLTFWVLEYTYMIVLYIKNDFNIDVAFKRKLKIIIVLGFLTQYYFCVYIISVFIFVEILIYKRKSINNCIAFFKLHISAALIGIVIYPASIYHIFFSYRGIPAISNNLGILEFFKLICKSFSFNLAIGFILLVFIVVITLYISSDKKRMNIDTILMPSVFLYVLIVSKISPYLDMRYIMCILPIIAILIWVSIDDIISILIKKCIIIIALTLFSTFFATRSIFINEPLYLYTGYSKNIEIARNNSNLSYIYIEDNGYNHIQSMPEFMIYNKSLILNINKNELEFIKDNVEIKQEKSFIVSIKNYLDVEGIVNEIMKMTESNSYEILLDGKNKTQNVIYIFYK